MSHPVIDLPIVHKNEVLIEPAAVLGVAVNISRLHGLGAYDTGVLL